jgi:threonine aldolase
MKIIDLRSDTVTHPTAEMRKAMFEAEVGDDVYGEDPSINRLETMAAERTGKESALFTSSGTQSNLIAVLTHTRHGNEIILGSDCHIFINEVGGAAALGGVVTRTLPNDRRGRIDPEEVKHAIRTRNIHYPETALLCLENTHNRSGGTVLDVEYSKAMCQIGHENGLKMHLDGARIFNAAVALDVPVKKLTADFDSVNFCISKGLSAPVGSLLCGDNDFITRARKVRKMLGGGMRQAGVLAAAGIVALETMVDRLAEDHAHAMLLAKGLAKVNGITVNEIEPPTNIVLFELSPKIAVNHFIEGLEKAGLKVNPRGGNLFRAVTHRMISAGDIREAAEIVAEVTAKLIS